MINRAKKLEKFEEEVRILRSEIYQKNFKTILITSADKSCGKTTISKRLAKLIALENNKTLLLDCNLRDKKENKSKNQTFPYKYIVKNKSGYDFMEPSFVEKNQVEFLNSKAMQDFIENIKQRYEYIIIDTSNARDFSDSQILSKYVDGIYMVLEKDKTKIDDIETSLNNLKIVDAKIEGFLINKV